MTTAPGSERPSIDRPGLDLPAQDRQAHERQADPARRDHIAAAAERAFVRHGFHAATMNQVAEEAGMSAGNLYRYFPSIDHEVLMRLLQRVIADERLLGLLWHILNSHAERSARSWPNCGWRFTPISTA